MTTSEDAFTATGWPRWGKIRRHPMPPEEPDLHDEICDSILEEMKVVSREEWFAIAREGKPGVPGFSPMRQLQMKIRDNPLTFVPEIMGVFRMAAGNIMQRVIDWPNPGWKVARVQAHNDGLARHKGIDRYPYRTIDPYIDRLDREMEERGIDHPKTRNAAKELLRVCIKEYSYGKNLEWGIKP